MHVFLAARRQTNQQLAVQRRRTACSPRNVRLGTPPEDAPVERQKPTSSNRTALSSVQAPPD
jgi:hypothetical protein